MGPTSTKIIPLFLALILIFSETSLAQSCAVNCTALTENFGTSAVCPGTSGSPESASPNPYMVNMNNQQYGSPPLNSPFDGEYAVRCSNGDWTGGWYPMSDADGLANGNFLMVNAGQVISGSLTSNSGDFPYEFYHRQIDNLCPGSVYQISIKAGNLASYNAANSNGCYWPALSEVQIYAMPATASVQPSSTVYNGSTGTLVAAAPLNCVSGGFVWNTISGNFTMPALQTSFDLVLVSRYLRAAGNDFVIDDIKVTWVSGGVLGNRPGDGCTGSLPVELVSFTAEKLSQNALLKWSTASENNFSYFSIEKSEDGINFSEAGRVNSRGSASASASYDFFDFNSTSYYRLKMVDLDGSGKYSNIVALPNEKDRYCKVFQKESGELEIRVNSRQSSSIKVLVYSVLGQKYAEEEINLPEGTNVIVKDFHLRDKIVLVRIVTSEGEELFSNKVSLF